MVRKNKVAYWNVFRNALVSAGDRATFDSLMDMARGYVMKSEDASLYRLSS